jgi:hypothetical protein
LEVQPPYNFYICLSVQNSSAVLLQYLIAAIIVVGLSYSTDEGTLRDAFSHYGEVVDGTSVLVLSLRSS